MIRLFRLRIKTLLIIAVLSSTLVSAQDHKLGGRLSIGVSPMAFGIGATYIYKMSDKIIVRGLLEVEFISGETQSFKLYRSVNFYTKSLSCQLLFKPFNINSVFYIGAGMGYYFITGDDAHSHAGDIDKAYIKGESLSNSLGFDILFGTDISDNFALDFNYRLLLPTQILELDPYDGSPEYTKEQKLDIHLVSINLTFAFSL